MNVSSSAGIAAGRDVRDEDPQRHADLRRRQPDARRGVHRLDHVVDELLDVRCDFGDGGGRLVKHLVAVAKDRPDHLRGEQAAQDGHPMLITRGAPRGAKRRRTCSAVAS